MPCNAQFLINSDTHTANVGPGCLFMPSVVQIFLGDNLSLTKFAVSTDKTTKTKMIREVNRCTERKSSFSKGSA